MRRWCRGRDKQCGTSLVEMLVCCALMGLMLTCIYTMLHAAIRYYRNSNATLELQHATLIALTAISNELIEGSRTSFRVDDDPPIMGIVFGSPRTAQGKIEYTGTKLRWQKLVCYYLDEVNGVKCLVRKEETRTSQSFPPLISNDEDCEYFRNGPEPARIVARNITVLETTQTFPIPLEIEGEISDQYAFKVRVRTLITMKN